LAKPDVEMRSIGTLRHLPLTECGNADKVAIGLRLITNPPPLEVARFV